MQLATAITPMAIEVGLSQLVIMFPAALPNGTRPEAIPPIAAPSANGVTTDATADAWSIARRWTSRDAAVRRAYAAPRTMIPRPASSSGTASVDAIEPNAAGYAVQLTVSTKISQTWLASHTGAIDSCAC